MFISDDAPDRVSATPAATAQLRALARAGGSVTLLLDDRSVHVLTGHPAPHGSVRLGGLDDCVTFAADDSGSTAWWRNRAEIDLTDQSGFGYALRALDEGELYAAVAAGPLPRI